MLHRKAAALCALRWSKVHVGYLERTIDPSEHALTNRVLAMPFNRRGTLLLRRIVLPEDIRTLIKMTQRRNANMLSGANASRLHLNADYSHVEGANAGHNTTGG